VLEIGTNLEGRRWLAGWLTYLGRGIPLQIEFGHVRPHHGVVGHPSCVCVCVWVWVWVWVWVYVSMDVCVYVSMDVCVYMSLWVWYGMVWYGIVR
jgi:hypothetical protein